MSKGVKLARFSVEIATIISISVVVKQNIERAVLVQ
jgi:hypothetical protein